MPTALAAPAVATLSPALSGATLVRVINGAALVSVIGGATLVAQPVTGATPGYVPTTPPVAVVGTALVGSSTVG